MWLLLVGLLTTAAIGPDAPMERGAFGQSVVFAGIGLIIERSWRSAVRFQSVDFFYYVAPTPDRIVRTIEIRGAMQQIAFGILLAISVMGAAFLVGGEESFWSMLGKGSGALVAGAALSRFLPWSARLAFGLLVWFAVCSILPPAVGWLHSSLERHWDEVSLIWPPLWAYREGTGWEWPALAVLGGLVAVRAWRDSAGASLDREEAFSTPDGMGFGDDGEDWDDKEVAEPDHFPSQSDLAKSIAGRPEAQVWRWLSPREKLLTCALKPRLPRWSPRLKWSIGLFLLSYGLLLLGRGPLAPLFENIRVLGKIWNGGILLLILGAAAAVWPSLGGFGKEWLRNAAAGSLGMVSSLAAFPVSVAELIRLRLKELWVRSAFAAAIYAGYSCLALRELEWINQFSSLGILTWCWTMYWAVLAFGISHLFLSLQSTISDEGSRRFFSFSAVYILVFLAFLGASGLCFTLPFAMEDPGARTVASVVLNPLAAGFAMLTVRLFQRSWRDPRMSLLVKGSE